MSCMNICIAFDLCLGRDQAITFPQGLLQEVASGYVYVNT